MEEDYIPKIFVMKNCFGVFFAKIVANYYLLLLGPETFKLPFPKCHTCSWENDNFGK